ncbi:hypothetical protein B0H14DRAFT_3471602 [Mycena olivaceomarginata]|nr:hypothetical protein B0H14DRAFT_3471602 [Mycena olivaceomarginata]
MGSIRSYDRHISMSVTMHIYTDIHTYAVPAPTSTMTSTTAAATASDAPSADGEVEGLLLLVDRLSSMAMEAMHLAEEVRATIPGVIANKVARASAAASPAYSAGPLWLGGVSRTPAKLEAAHPEGTGEICSTLDAPIASSATANVTTVPPRSLCEHCEMGRLSHCSHNFSVVDHARAANHLEPYTRLSNERGNELITDLSAARADYELAREQLFRASARIAVASNRVSTWIRGVITNLGVYGLPRITEIPEALRPLWGQLLEDAEADLSVEYRAAIQRYPFISDPRRADLPSDEDLPTLIEFLTRRAARAHQPTPLPEEESNWPDEGEAGPSGSK